MIENYFDNLGRQTEERWKDGGATVRSIAFGWDANGQLTTADDDGTNARDYDWFFDNLGRLTESEFAAAGYTWEFKHGYDGDSNRDSNRDSRDLLRSGTTQFSDAFSYDDLNRQTSLARDAVNWGHDLRAEFDYNAAGQFEEIRRYSDTAGTSLIVSSHYGYDGMGRLTSLDHKNSSETSITGYGWTYDTAGRMAAMDFTNSTYNTEDVTAFGYDRTNQLLSGDRSGTSSDEAYAYDTAGNRTSANGASYTTTSNNRLTNDGTFTYTYDDEGNRLTRVRISGAAADDKTVEYTWDYRNRLEKVTFKRNDGTVTKTVEFRYDMFNQVTQKVVDPDGALGSASLQTDDYLWDGDELAGVFGYNSLVFASGPARDMILFESASSLHALLGDHQNTVRDVINTSGAVENHLVYNSYGELKSQTGGGAYSPFHRYTGKPFDVAVGLQYNVNRWYDPSTGRWTSEDPIGFGGGHANLNVYTGNSPTNGVDPYGLQKVIQTKKVGSWQFRVIQDRDGNEFTEWTNPDGSKELTAPNGAPGSIGRDGEPQITPTIGGPSLSEPSSEVLAGWGTAIATGGVWGYIKEIGESILDAWLGPAPGPRPGRPNGGGAPAPRIKVYTNTDFPVDLNRPGGTFTPPKNITTPESFYPHFQNVVPWNPQRPPGTLPPFVTQISIPPGSLLPDPTIPYTPGGVWLPPGTPGATVTGIWIISEDSSGLFNVFQFK